MSPLISGPIDQTRRRKKAAKNRKPGPYKDKYTFPESTKKKAARGVYTAPPKPAAPPRPSRAGKRPGPYRTGLVLTPEKQRKAVRVNYRDATPAERAKLRKQGGDTGKAIKAQRAGWKRFDKLADEGERIARQVRAKQFVANTQAEVDRANRAIRAANKRSVKDETRDAIKAALKGAVDGVKPTKLKRVRSDGAVKSALKLGPKAAGAWLGTTAPAPVLKPLDKTIQKYVTSGKASADIRKTGGKAFRSLNVGGGQTAGLGGSELKKTADGNPAKWAQRAGEDLIGFPTDAVAATAQVASAVNQARKGNTGPAKQLLKEVEEGDPSYALLSAAVNTVTGDTKGAKSDVQRFLRIADQNPGLTALSLAGTKGAIGRGGGSIVRGGGRVTGSKKLKAIGAVGTRQNATVPKTSVEVDRSYSPDLINKAAQVALDRRGTKRAAKLRRQADVEHKAGNPEKAAQLRRRAAGTTWTGRAVDPLRAQPRDMHRQVDRTEFIAEEVRRDNVAKADKRVAETQKGVNSDDLAANITITRGITDNTLDDLKAYRNELKAVYKDLRGDEKVANQQLREALDRTIEAPDAPQRIAALTEAAKQYSAKVDQPLDARLADLGIIDPKRAEKAKLAATVFREGAEVSEKIVPTQAGVAAKATKKANRQAKAELEAALDRYAPKEGQTMPTRGRSLVDDVLDADATVARTKAAAKAANLDGRKGKAAAGLVDKDGNKITLKDLRKRTADREVPPSYLSLKPGKSGDHYQPTGREPTIGGQKLRGGSIKKGTIPIDDEMMTRRAVKAEGLATAAEQRRKALRDTAVRGDDGKVLARDREAARGMAAELSNETGTDYVAVQANPFGATRRQFEAILDDLDNADVNPADGKAAAGQAPKLNDLLHQAWSGQGDGDFVIVPKAVADRQLQHLNKLGMSDLEKGARAVRTTWSRTVLATSPGPTASNLIEGTGRMAAAKSGPLSYARAKRVLAKLSPEERQRVETGLLGGTRVELSTRTRHTDASQFLDGRTSQKIAKAVEELRAATRIGPEGRKVIPGPGVAFKAWDIWTQVVFGYLQRVPERHMKTAHMGRAMQQLGFFDDTIVGLSSKAAQQAADGLKGTPTQVKLGTMLDDMHGKYSGFGPDARWLISNYTPFLAWWMSAANFVYRVLPRDHPTATALIVAMELATEDAREAMDVPPWEVMNVGRVRLGRHTPFAIADAGFSKTFGSMVLPQGSTLLEALDGRDWKGNKLEHEDGTPYTEAEKLTYGMWESLKTATPAIHAPMQAIKYAKDPETMTRAVLAPKKTAKGKADQRIFRIGKQLDELKGSEFRKWQKGGQKGPMPRNRYISAQGYYTPEAQRLVDERKRLKKQRDEAEGKRKQVRARERPKPKSGSGLGSGLGGSLGGGL